MNGPMNGKAPLPGLGGPTIAQQAARRRHGERITGLVKEHIPDFERAYGPIQMTPATMLVAFALLDRIEKLEAFNQALREQAEALRGGAQQGGAS
jgi:hypothetical protein